MLATHMDAERRYDRLRRESLKATANQIKSIDNLDFRLIDDFAISVARKWKGRLAEWDWSDYPHFKMRYPKRFELALWHRKNLVSLSAGRPTYHATGLRLDFVERNPEQVDLGVFRITLAALDVYADALGARELRVMHPVNDRVRKYYETFGLQYVKKGDYLFITRV